MTPELLVMKFGGTSVGSAERIAACAGLIARSRRQRPVVAVVSAMSKITDMLLETMRRGAAGDRAGMEANIRELEERHAAVVKSLFAPERHEELLGAVRSRVQEFERICRGMLMLGERPPRSVDEAVATGEKLTALLVASLLNARGAPAEPVDASRVIVTDATFGNASPILEKTRERAQEALASLLERGVVPVVTGFNGATADGRPTTLGRGGSDFSASILAAALDATTKRPSWPITEPKYCIRAPWPRSSRNGFPCGARTASRRRSRVRGSFRKSPTAAVCGPSPRWRK
jgi:aspartate kinase